MNVPPDMNHTRNTSEVLVGSNYHFAVVVVRSGKNDDVVIDPAIVVDLDVIRPLEIYVRSDASAFTKTAESFAPETISQCIARGARQKGYHHLP
jgi:hypothetical protein